MNRTNILNPIKLPKTNFTFASGENILEYLKTNHGVWYEANKKKLYMANSIRLYAKNLDTYVLVDGNIASDKNGIMIAESNHFIENVDLRFVSIYAPGEVVVQIGIIG